LIRFPCRRILCLALLLSASGCVREQPALIIPPSPIGDGGRLVRELYRSSWTPPANDGGLLRIGIIPSRNRVRFRALAPMRIRAYSESDSWEVASPAGVVWKADAGAIVRPPIVSHFAAVRETLLGATAAPAAGDLTLWRSRGYSGARWVGPHPLDDRKTREPFERWFLALAPPTEKAAAARICDRARLRFGGSCRVISRVELPPIGEGTLTAENSTFSKSFRGFLELLSPSAPVEILDFLPEERTGETSIERYGPRLFVIPNLAGELSLVQSTSLGNYLEGVVPSEIFPEAPAAALAAQAIVARTYALRFFRHPDSDRPYLICASTDCQVYRGVTYKRDGPSTAVRATADLVLRESSGGFAETFYHSICGGHSEPRQAIWGNSNRGYLIGVSDELPGRTFAPLGSDAAVAAYLDAPATSYCGTSSFTKADRWRWSADLDRPALDALAEKVGLAPPLHDVIVRKRGVSGRALEVELRNGAVSKVIDNELRIRQTFGGLLSSLFVVEATKDGDTLQALHIRGAGYGHGVGLCQVGAVGRAEAGQTFEEILRAYYPGTLLAPLEKGVVR
jgi:SpoIID/LytB domain protein